MQRTITTMTVDIMTATKDENGEFKSVFGKVITIAKNEKEAKKEFEKTKIAGVIIGYGEPVTAVYEMDDYEYLRKATVKKAVESQEVQEQAKA